MELTVEQEPLKEILKSFYVLTKMRVVIFDVHGEKVCSYPEEDSFFCQCIQKGEGGKKRCEESNEASFTQCKKTGKIAIFHCHASLIEATAVLKREGSIIGYAMIGQCSPYKDKSERLAKFKEACHPQDKLPESLEDSLSKIIYKGDEEFKSAAIILQALVNYLVLNDLIHVKKNVFRNKLNAYIEEHIDENITMNDLCRYFGYGKTKLFQVSKANLTVSLSSYLDQYKIERAKQMLKEEHRPIADIADALGFYDASHFCKVFKKMTSQTPAKYRKKHSY